MEQLAKAESKFVIKFGQMIHFLSLFLDYWLCMYQC